MTSISPWFRGYRRALRDVQHCIDQHVHSSTDAITYIYFMVADEITISLRDLKYKDSDFRQLVYQKENRFRYDALTNPTSSEAPATTEIPQHVLFNHGYRSGFTDAITIVEDYKSSMNDPAAGTAISPLIAKLEEVQIQLKETTDGKLVTLKRCKYVI